MGQTQLIIRTSLRVSTHNYVNLKGMRLDYVIGLCVNLRRILIWILNTVSNLIATQIQFSGCC